MLAENLFLERSTTVILWGASAVLLVTWQSADSSQQYIADTSLNISGLQPNTTYYFGVKATNASGSGAWSSIITALTAADSAQPTFPEIVRLAGIL